MVLGYGDSRRRVGCRIGCHLGDTPIQDQHFAERPDHDILRLEIAVDDPVGMSERDRLADALEDSEPLGKARGGVEVFIQSSPFDPLHDVVHAAIGERADVVHGNDAGVFQAGDDAGLAEHAVDGFLVEHSVADDFKGHGTSQGAILSQIYRSHSPLADPLGDAIARVVGRVVLDDVPQVIEREVIQRAGHEVVPKTRRASSRNSSSLAVSSRSTSKTQRRKLRRAQARKLVTCVTGKLNSAASWS